MGLGGVQQGREREIETRKEREIETRGEQQGKTKPREDPVMGWGEESKDLLLRISCQVPALG